MKFILSDSFRKLGIEHVVIGIARNVSTTVPLSDEFIKIFTEKEQEILQLDESALKDNEIINGYKELVSSVGRSVKKNPPTVLSFISNIKHRGSIPHINSVVDVYNIESLNSYLAIGGHDLDKFTFPVEFTVSGKEDVFYPISAPEKYVADYDFLYRDQKGIIAYLGCRDSELYKLDENTRNVAFIIHGNAHTGVEYRKEALERIFANLRLSQPDIETEILVI